MTSNIKRAVTLTLLAGMASSALAAKAPVTDLSATSSSATAAPLQRHLLLMKPTFSA